MLQMVAPRGRRADVVAALLAAHPYEEPAFEVIELAAPDSGRGGGRVGELAEPLALREFADLVAATLPPTAHGVRVAGDPTRMVRRVAVCGGAGDSLLGSARASGADAYLTSDLRHHRASEHLEAGGCALVDVAHWAAEWMWLPQAARLLEQDAAAAGIALGTTVSTTVTDPWSFHVGRPTDAR
jgi:putative NIF3 family GTP cyclohydrolase 1 type 2